MRPPRRWPLHPPPGPLESLSSWARRLARLYGMQVPELLGHNLGLIDLTIPANLDRDPPLAMLAALAERTGVDLAQVRATTLAGWVPWLVDSLTVEPHQAQDVFDSYVHANPVLLEPGATSRHLVHRWKTWRSPWLSKSGLDRVCPLCVHDPDRGRALMWQLPLMLSCIEHGYQLENRTDLEVALALGRPPPMQRVEEPVATMDRYTYEALTTGEVVLPGRTVHAGAWFRLLRSLLDELSLATTTLNFHGRTTLEFVWRTTGGEQRAGLAIWQPFEQLEWPAQETMLRAAAIALALVADGRISARGVFGPALHQAAHQPVYDGDRPPPDINAMMDEVIAEARRDRATARQLLTVLTFGCRSLLRFEDERAYLLRLGVPAEFIPGARELGRLDLLS
ncbi:TniQ family protein [Amycolatopsis magusensis]|uniref:TniQ family protein n=1 Tax=Amycolatopsis magusensis TaxID=882444 RepID=UPI0024A947D2|nr:TniQ family protein [Amycolatopsis magusensis]MDI5978235.1 TniQ family protein [Amycolatopsis magusensis]